MKETIIEKSKINMLLIKILMVFTILILIIGGLTIDSRLVTNSISDQVIRFHVVANSDTVEDQLLKQRVKDEAKQGVRRFARTALLIHRRLFFEQRIAFCICNMVDSLPILY